MTRRRFHAAPDSFAADMSSATLNADETRHLRDVLRLKVNDEVHVFDGTGREFRCEIAEVDWGSARLTIIAELAPASPESGLDLILAVALLKGEKFDLVVQKATELGVTSLIPIITSRADVRIRNDDDAERKITRWQRIALEATKQCGRARLMKIEPPVSFSNLVSEARPRGPRPGSPAGVGRLGRATFASEPLLTRGLLTHRKQSTSPNELRLMFAERDGGSFDGLLDASGAKPDSVLAMIGSEGGFADEEIDQAREAGWKIVTLGGRIMRAETAAIAIAALLQHRFGDLT